MANILVLSSLNRNYPVDIANSFTQVGHDIIRIKSIEEFNNSPKRCIPFLGIFEIGGTEDYDHAFSIFDWAENVQPIANAGYILLLSNQNFDAKEKIKLFHSADIVILPMPMKNVIFKAELRWKLISQKKQVPKISRGFIPTEVKETDFKKRVIKFKGPTPKEGHWSPQNIGPAKGIRWRWIELPKAKEPESNTKLDWVAENSNEPQFDREGNWSIEGTESNLTCFAADKQIYSSIKMPASKDSTESNKSTINSSLKSLNSNVLNSLNSKNDSKDENEKLSILQPAKNEINSSKNLASAKQPLEQPNDEKKKITDRSSLPEMSLGADNPVTLSLPGETETEAKTPTLNQDSKEPRKTVPQKIEELALSQNSSNPVAEEMEPPGGSSQQSENLSGNVGSEKNTQERDSAISLTTSLKTTLKENNFTGTSKITEEPKPQEPIFEMSESDFLKALIPYSKAAPVAKETLAPTTLPIRAANSSSSEQKAPAAQAIRSSEMAIKKIAKKPDLFEKKDEWVARTTPTAPLQEPKIQKAQTPSAKNEKVPKVSCDESTEIMEEDRNPLRRGISETESFTAISGCSHLESSLKLTVASSENENNFDLTLEGKNLESSNTLTTEKKGNEEDYSANHRKLSANRLSVIMTLDSLGDQNSAWIPVGNYRIYLSSQWQYSKAKSLDKVFPLWVYEGELAPEFLPDQNSWKFYDRRPIVHSSFELLDSAIVNFLVATQNAAESP